MMIARWSFDAKFSHKDQAIEMVQTWMRDVAPQIGWSEEKARILTSSAGAPESRVQLEVEIDDLADLDAAWKRLPDADGHGSWGRSLEEHIVSGTPRWEVFHVAS